MFNAFNSNMSYFSWPARVCTVDKTKGRQGRSQGKAKEKDSTCSAAAGTAAEEGTVSHDLILENIHIQNRYIYVYIYISLSYHYFVISISFHASLFIVPTATLSH